MRYRMLPWVFLLLALAAAPAAVLQASPSTHQHAPVLSAEGPPPAAAVRSAASSAALCARLTTARQSVGRATGQSDIGSRT